jgi:RimJ/RimL family protein N-acetyltransferase
MRDTATMKTERLLLRPFRPEDAAAVAAAVANYDVSRWLAVVPFPYSLADAAVFVVSPAAAARRTWAICDGSGIVGAVSVDGELGYWLVRNAWGRGYGTEAARAAMGAAFADSTRTGLEASHMVGNDRSARVLEKLGFRPTGMERRHFCALGQDVPVRTMTISRGEWRGRDGPARLWPFVRRRRALA